MRCDSPVESGHREGNEMTDPYDVIRALVAALTAKLPRCGLCGGPDAACYGRYEGQASEEFACNLCCGHGSEDGHCEPLPELDAIHAGQAALDAVREVQWEVSADGGERTATPLPFAESLVSIARGSK
jgi:hypothetical protein